MQGLSGDHTKMTRNTSPAVLTLFVMAFLASCSDGQGTAVATTSPAPMPPSAPVTTAIEAVPAPAPTNVVPSQYDCASDADCTLSCAYGAVNRRWYQANQATVRAHECDDGCASAGYHTSCVEGTCMAYDQADRLDEACSRRVVP